jgi:hypothetical protein
MAGHEIVLRGTRDKPLVYDADTQALISHTGENLVAAPVKMLLQEGGDHRHLSDMDEAVLVRVPVPGELMGKNGKLQLGYIAASDGTGAVTFRAYFGPADSALGDAELVQVGADTTIAEGHRQRCSLEVQNRNDVTDQSGTPNVPMNTPEAAYTATFDCEVNTNADCELVLTGQCASADGVANALAVTCLFVDPPDPPLPPWAIIFDPKVKGKKLHVGATGLFGGSFKPEPGDWVRISYGNRQLSPPVKVKAMGVFIIWNELRGSWFYNWKDQFGATKIGPLSELVSELGLDTPGTNFLNKFGGAQFNPLGVRNVFDDPDVPLSQLAMVEQDLNQMPQISGSRAPGGTGFEVEGGGGGSAGAWAVGGEILLLGMSVLIPHNPKREFPLHPQFHCQVGHRAVTWAPGALGKHDPGGGILRVRVMWSAFPGWHHIVGDPNYQWGDDSGDPEMGRPILQFKMGDYEHVFRPTHKRCHSFVRAGTWNWGDHPDGPTGSEVVADPNAGQPGHVGFGLSTMVFDAYFNLEYRAGPVLPYHANVRAGAVGCWTTPIVGLGDNPVYAKAADSWTSGQALTRYGIKESDPFHLVNGGWYEYYPALIPPPVMQA